MPLFGNWDKAFEEFKKENSKANHLTAEIELPLEKYKEQCKLRFRIREWTKIVYFRIKGLKKAINVLFRNGVYLKLEEKKYIFLPIVGENNWNKESWEEWKKALNNEQRQAIREMLNKLVETAEKPMYFKSCATSSECKYKIDTSCFFSNCKYGRKKFDELIQTEYEKKKKIIEVLDEMEA